MQSKAIAIVASAALVVGGAVISSQVIGADALVAGLWQAIMLRCRKGVAFVFPSAAQAI